MQTKCKVNKYAGGKLRRTQQQKEQQHVQVPLYLVSKRNHLQARIDDACMVDMYAPDEKRSENFMISDLDPDTRNNPSSINALTKKNNNKCERKGRKKKKS